MKKIIIGVSAMLFAAGIFATGTKDAAANGGNKKVKIGIAKIVQHDALDAIEKGVMDAVKAAGIDAEFDLQNANGDVNTAAQIANS